jgi:hypothetical protein
MATRVLPAPIDADNSSGSVPAARSDWRFGDADSMSARDAYDPTSDAGYTTAGVSPTAKLLISFLPLRGSPYMTCYASRWFLTTSSMTARKTRRTRSGFKLLCRASSRNRTACVASRSGSTASKACAALSLPTCEVSRNRLANKSTILPSISSISARSVWISGGSILRWRMARRSRQTEG